MESHRRPASSTCVVDENLKKLVALIVRMMFILKKKFPFPNELQGVNENMFDQPNTQLMSSVLHYILYVINPEKCSMLVPHPLSARSTAHFQKGVMKFLTQTFNELPHMKIDGLRNSTIASSSGSRFIEFLARLITNTVRLVNEKRGVIGIPNCRGLGADDKLNLMQAKRDRAIDGLLQLEHSVSDIPRYQEALQKLKVVTDRLDARYKEVVSSCPPPYAELLGSCDRERAREAFETWKNSLKKSLVDLTSEHLSIQDSSKAIRGDGSYETALELTRLGGDQLINPDNEQILSKVAEDQQIQLFDGHAVSLPGFLECSSTIVDKLNTIIQNSKFKESIQQGLAIDSFFEIVSELESEMGGNVVTTEGCIERLKNDCIDHQRKYDELVVEGHITHRYSYSRPFPDPDLKIPPRPESELSLSPGNSWKEQLEDARRQCDGIEEDSSAHVTPKTSRRRIDDSSSSSLSRTVLEKQAWASGSRGADLTVGEMFQGPLSSSSPVNCVGDQGVIASTRTSISDMIGEISLHAELNDFLADVSEMEDSDHLSSDAILGESQSSALPEIPSRIEEASSPASLPPPSAIPAAIHRCPRPSLDIIVKRYAAWRANHQE